MANIAIFRINYKSDFILTLNSDAGWMTPFCIKFWTGAPSQAYFAGYDGETYTHCAPVVGEPTKLLVQFDDHHLPIGDLKFQIGYHFTVADFPTTVEDEVINQAAVIIDQDGTPMQVMLDLNGETAPEIEFSLPAYANEAQRIANEEQRIAAEQQRISHEESRIVAETIRQQNETQRINNEAQRIRNEEARIAEFAQMKAEAIEATDAANSAAALANEKAALAADKAALADSAATIANDKAALAQAAAQLANDKAQLAADKAALAQAASQLCDEKAALAQQKATYAQQQGDYSKAQGDYAKEQGDYSKAQGDYSKEQGDYSKEQGDYAKDKGDICAADHQTAVADHQTATADHQTAAADHQTATTDHNQAGNDHTRAESDHTRAESDHAAVEVYVDSLGAFDISAYNATGGVLAKYAGLTAALGTNGANIPDALRKGGMSVKFVQSSDNKYVQFRLMTQDFSVNEADWQGVDDEPIAGSNNLVKSGGVAELQQYAYFNLNFIGEGNVQNLFIRRLYLKPDKVYRLTLSKTDWLVNSISAENVIFSYGRYDGNGQTVAIAWFTPAQQSEIPATIILNENNYSDATGFYVAFRGDVGEKVSLSIEDITEKYLYNKISVTRNQELTTGSSFLNYTELLKNDLNVCCLIKSESLSVITVGYYIKGSNSVTVVVDHSNKIGEIINFTIPQGTELRGLALYASPSAVVSDGEVEYCFILDNSLSLPIKSITEKIDFNVSVLSARTTQLEYKTRTAASFSKAISTTLNTEISGKGATLSVAIKAGCVYSVVVVDQSRSLYYASAGNYLFAVNYSDGTKLNAQPFIPNVLEYKVAEKDVVSIGLWVRNTAVVANGTIYLKVIEHPNMASVDYASIIRNNFANMSILGNSWSTYYKWIPSANASWYAFDGVDGHNARVGEETLNHVDSVTQTWWWMLSNETKTKLLVNESYSGSAIGEGHAQSISFIPRMVRSIGEERTLEPKPDIIFIEGGTNDAQLSDVSVGDVKYSGWTESDLNDTIPAFCYILDYLKKWNPGAVIVNLVNQTLLSASESSVRTKGKEIMNKMRTSCTHYGVYNYEMAFINKENNHPSQNGMTQIKEQVKGFLNAVLTGNIGI